MKALLLLAAALSWQNSLTHGLVNKEAAFPFPGDTQALPSEFECEIETNGPICFTGSGQEQVLLPPALATGLEGSWSFDEALAMDASGNKFHGEARVAPALGFGGQGNSAYFRKSFQAFPGTSTLQMQDFSLSFWFYLMDDSSAALQTGLRYCPLARKGVDSTVRPSSAPPSVAASPAILFDRETGKLRVELATAGDVVGQNLEAFESNAKLTKGVWFHIALVRLNGQKRTRLYVNGILDASQSTQGYTAVNNEPLYIGGDPLSYDLCDLPMYIDELKLYSRSLTPDEIQAEAAPALNGIEPSFVRLSCVSCELRVAQENCPAEYHICNSLELHLGGYQVARSLGWLERDTHVWSHSLPVGDPLAPGPAPTPGPVPGLFPLFNGGMAAVGAVLGLPGFAPAPAPGVAGPGSTPASGPGPGPFPTPAPGPGPAPAKLGLGLCCRDDL